MAPAVATPQPAPSLSLPPSQFARLQPHSYLLAHLAPAPTSSRPSIRPSGRTASQFRPASVNTGSLTHTNGSAVVRVGDTAAVCGVRAEILQAEDIAAWNVSTTSGDNVLGSKRRKTRDQRSKPTEATQTKEGDNDAEESYDEIQNLNLLVPNISLNTGCSPLYTPGAAPPTFAQSLSHQLLSLLHTSRLVCPDNLRIWYQPPDLAAAEREGEGKTDDDATYDKPEEELKAFWVLYIDVLIISLAGNPFDAAWAAVVAALRNTRLPKAWWDAENELVVCSDAPAEASQLNLRGLPISSTFAVFEADAAAEWRAVVRRAGGQQGKDQVQARWILADPDAFEEGLCSERICVVVDGSRTPNGKAKIIRLEKNGGVSVGREEVRHLVDLATSRWTDWKNILEAL